MVRGLRGDEERGDGTYFFFMLVFGAHDSLFAMVWPHGCYIDEEACLDVYPSCVDHVEKIFI